MLYIFWAVYISLFICTNIFLLQLKGLGYPYSKCEKEHQTTFYSNYTVAACRIECETKLIYEECGCRLVESPGNYPVCDVDNFDCAEEILCKFMN